MEISKETLAKLFYSHYLLNKAEYDRDNSYNNSHFAFRAEKAVMDEIGTESLELVRLGKNLLEEQTTNETT